VSSGTLFALGLLTVVLGPDSANVVLLDDLDHGLHPRAQLELIGVFRKLIDDNPELQIIATAHSPYILDRLQPNEVRVMSLRDDGAAVCVPLTDHPEFERWRDAMSPGEFWSTFYEDWLTRKPEPQPAR
jgi:predicted ATPase